jgi:tetratricopeptide (TPR) repeat protein
MMEGIWLPGLIVLGVGLVAGAVLAWRLRRGGTASSSADTKLRIGDLEARREELYRRLREGGITGDERATLELAAARVLRELDQLGVSSERPAGLPEGGASGEAGEGGTAAAHAHDHPGPRSRWSGLVGFAAGVAVAGLVGLLIYWAGRDAAPGERAAPAPMAGPVDPNAELPPDHPPVNGGPTEDETERIAALNQRLTEDPTDLMARKELSLVQLSAGMYVDAFESASEVLGDNPDDPDGLFVQGVVRLTMGQNEQAIDLFDRVLAGHPDHLQALAYRGLGLYQSGQGERAVDTWEMGLEMAGGQSPQFEALLQMAEQQPVPVAAERPPHPVAGQGVGEVRQPAARTAAPEAPAAPAASPGVAAASSGSVYPVRIELAAGSTPSPGAVLFVALRSGAGGPPAAVRRIASPGFPLEIELSQSDSMMGAALPESGLLTARLDSDGSVTTRSPGDLAAEMQVTVGQGVTLILQSN